MAGPVDGPEVGIGHVRSGAGRIGGLLEPVGVRSEQLPGDAVVVDELVEVEENAARFEFQVAHGVCQNFAKELQEGL